MISRTGREPTRGTLSANFGFLTQHDAQLVRLGALAERYFRDDPNTCLIKLRQFGEVLAQLVAAKAGRERRGFNRATVAVANKTVRIIWAVLRTGEPYRAAA